MKPLNRTGAGVLVAAFLVLPYLAATAMGAPVVQKQGDVTFVSGGIGEDELNAMKTLEPNYPVHLLFIAKGEPARYLADVKVQIRDKSGQIILDTVSQGPILLATLPPGTYAIRVQRVDEVAQRDITVAKGRNQRSVFSFNRPVDQ